jgi:hypothetical protein
MGLVVEPIADGGHTSDHVAVALGDEVLRLRMLEEGVLAAGEE